MGASRGPCNLRSFRSLGHLEGFPAPRENLRNDTPKAAEKATGATLAGDGSRTP